MKSLLCYKLQAFPQPSNFCTCGHITLDNRVMSSSEIPHKNTKGDVGQLYSISNIFSEQKIKSVLPVEKCHSRTFQDKQGIEKGGQSYPWMGIFLAIWHFSSHPITTPHPYLPHTKFSDIQCFAKMSTPKYPFNK